MQTFATFNKARIAAKRRGGNVMLFIYGNAKLGQPRIYYTRGGPCIPYATC